MGKRIFDFPIPADHEKVDAIIVCCTNPRFWNPARGNGLSSIDAFARDQILNFVPITETGGIRILASEKTEDVDRQRSLIHRLAKALDRYHPHVLLATACHDSVEPLDERQLSDDFWKAKKILEREFGSRVELQFFIFDLDGVIDAPLLSVSV